MCEVAILSTEEHGINEITHAAMTVYKSMRTSLGIVAITNIVGEYQYDIFKSLDPDVNFVRDFVESHHDDAVRFILHGRLATHGSNDIAAAHPIQIECSECDVDYVVHNGIVHAHEILRGEAQEDGHTFRTEVDSEAIAHKYGQAPTDIDEIDPSFEREPCYILLQPDRIFIHAGARYNLTEKGRLSKDRRGFGPNTGKYQDLIMEPVTEENNE